MPWVYLLIAAVFEVGWPVGLKLAEQTEAKTLWIALAIITMALSGIFLFLAQKTIPIGTAYAVWTGIGASCTFAIGILFFHDSLSMLRLLGILCIISGVILLKYGH